MSPWVGIPQGGVYPGVCLPYLRVVYTRVYASLYTTLGMSLYTPPWVHHPVHPARHRLRGGVSSVGVRADGALGSNRELIRE